MICPSPTLDVKVMMRWFGEISGSDYYVLARFLFPLSFTVIALDIGEQFLNRSIAHSAKVVDTLAAFGLGYAIVKVFVGILAELRHAGLVLVHDRSAYRRLLLFTAVSGSLVMLFLIITAKTQLGVWLIEDLHGVSSYVSELTHSALIYMCAYPLIDVISWYHGGILLQWHHSTLVGAASLADIVAQIFSVAILLYTPLVCKTPIAVPILAAYSGVLTRCTITLSGFFCLVYPSLSKNIISKVTLWRLLQFICPLMLVMFIQRVSRPLINLIVARQSSTKNQAAEAVAVLTASYPLGHLPYGWLNTLRPVIPAFQQISKNKRPTIAGKKLAFFSVACLAISAVASFVLGWIPGVSVAVLHNIIALPRGLAVKCVTPLRIFAFFCFTVIVRATLTGWITLQQQTKLVAPSAPIRLAAIISMLFILPQLGVTGADNGVGALFSGFFAEASVVAVVTSIYICWKRSKSRKVANVLVEEETSNDSPAVVIERKTDQRGSTIMSDKLTEQSSIDPFEESDIL